MSKRYRWDEKAGKLVELGSEEDWMLRDQRAPVFTDRYMEGVRAQDGTDIGSRAKRRDYMRINGLVDFDDCKGVWEKAAKERAKMYTPGSDFDRASRIEAINRAMYQHSKR